MTNKDRFLPAPIFTKLKYEDVQTSEMIAVDFGSTLDHKVTWTYRHGRLVVLKIERNK